MPLAPADDRAPDSRDLLSLLTARAAEASPASLYAMLGVSAVDFGLAFVFSGGRYYLAFPFLSMMCFAVYGLAAHRESRVTGDVDEDYGRSVDARLLMKISGMVGMASAIAALLCLFLLALGPSWIS
jgi:hypothetical protein